ncbi:unnamed protein product [Rotaria sp. Silwood2]|nr:unnamed protein product [Rotaria sp. Silwood2]CAF2852743.1 unnamed protein product [Rotaria sp. Silwood2]CAF3292576.1 unnamed protein product [Rotaria sp. Silwood2]CAF4051059.1 unnamed protein product [Rotaria sp. Silwood2]CAF4118924.1 unnamed protein product [Rotaria sp. Silwood2]
MYHNQAGKQNNQNPKFYRRCHVTTLAIVRRIASVGTTFRTIRDVIHVKCRKKRPVHRLYQAVIEKRRSRAWGMYRRLSNENIKTM